MVMSFFFLPLKAEAHRQDLLINSSSMFRQRSLDSSVGGAIPPSSSSSSSSSISSSADLQSNRLTSLDRQSISGLNHLNKHSLPVDSRSVGQCVIANYEALPSFKDVTACERQSMFIRKLDLCCLVFDFADPTRNLQEKAIKRQKLLELVDYVTSGSGKFSENDIQEATEMVSTNLFRNLALPPPEHMVIEKLDA